MSTVFATSASETVTPPPWDEMANGRGGLRPGWGALLASLFGLGAEVIARRAEQLERMLTEDGLTGLLPGVAPVAWRCDAVPLLIGAREFEQLEAGLAQRATLIEAVLRDIYGSQALLRDGLIPPGLLFANPAFLRPCRDAERRQAAGQRMHLYAAELIRGPDGRWRVVADRTADAAGIAYTLENRRALSRALPEAFRGAPPRGLVPFFDAWQDLLLRLAPAGTERPGLAVLTQGADDKLWFEHVVLAQELSCTLVESSDLTVRDGALFLKTLQGLQRIHVLLRRQAGATIDPLELELGPRLGVTGLLDAARAGSVRIVNDPGTGCLEAPLWSAVLPLLAGAVLGEELSLPSVETVWLGDAAARARVLGAPERWRIRPALDGTAAALAADSAAELVARIEASPEAFVASAPLHPSVAPCFAPEGLLPRPVLLRMFLMFDGQRWRALPGGLARIVSATDLAGSRLPLHAMCKDVWVASEEEEDIVGPQAVRPAVVAVRRTSGELPSRVAENFYWLGRSLERLEGSARLLRTALQRLERPGASPRESAELRSVAECLATAGLIEREAAAGLGPAALGERLLHVATPPAELPGLLAEVSRLTELLRDRLTREVHGTLSLGLRTLGQAAARLREPKPTTRHLDHLCTVVLGFAATVAGLAAENMVRSGGRLFLDLGRRVDRAWGTARLIAQALDQPAAAHPAPLEPGLRLALEFCDSAITYRGRYLTNLQPGPVLDLVLADEGNPRAIAFQLVAIRDILAELSRAPGAELPLVASGLLRDVREIARAAALAPERQVGSTVTARLRAAERGISTLSDRIARQYFAVLPAAHLVGARSRDERCGMMRYRVQHSTHYSYTKPVDLAANLLHLRLATSASQEVESETLRVSPSPGRLIDRQDHFGNRVTWLFVNQPHTEFEVVSEAVVVVRPSVPPAADATPAWEDVREAARAGGMAAAEFRFDSPRVPRLAAAGEYARASFTPRRPILAALTDLNERMFRDFKFRAGVTTITTPIAHVLERREGVCQDFTHLMLSGLRSLGLPARYTSGYIRTRPPPGQVRRRGADQSHAWVGGWLGAEDGWIGLDPTNGVIVALEHVVLAVGRDFSDISPLRGMILGGGQHSLRVGVDLEPLEAE